MAAMTSASYAPVASAQHGCTLSLTAADLEHRLYNRLWRNGPRWKAWRAAGGDAMRRLHDPMHFRGGETVIDVGSYVGIDLVGFLRHAPSSVSVHTFEPVQRYRTKLKQRVERFVSAANASRLHIHPFGLGRANHTACFLASKGAQATHEAVSSACAAPARIVDVAAALRNFARVDLMQINCEGCEYDLLERLLEDSGSIGVVQSVEVQFHLDWGAQRNTTRYCHIERGLRHAAFELDYRHPFLWERWSRRAHEVPLCASGIRGREVEGLERQMCCAKSCGACDDAGTCNQRPGGSKACCARGRPCTAVHQEGCVLPTGLSNGRHQQSQGTPQ